MKLTSILLLKAFHTLIFVEFRFFFLTVRFYTASLIVDPQSIYFLYKFIPRYFLNKKLEIAN